MRNTMLHSTILIACFVLTLILNLTSAHAGSDYLLQWGGSGNGAGQFAGVFGVSVDGNGNVYVADSQNQRIQKFNSSGTYLTQWKSLGDGKSYNKPVGVSVDGTGNVFVLDILQLHGQTLADFYKSWIIEKFDSSAAYKTKFSGSGYFESASPGVYSYPIGVSVDGDGNVYVADSWNNRILKYNSAGTFLAVWDDPSQFYYPQGVAVDRNDNVYVADTGNCRIQVFNSQGIYLTQWGNEGSSNGQFKYPTGVAVDSSGNVYVVDTGNNRIQVFDNQGTYLTQWGSQGSGNSQFKHPAGVAVDSCGNIYVADTGNTRIQKFSPITPVNATKVLTYAAGANGSLAGAASQTVNCGASGTVVTAVPNTGYHFVKWSDGSTANPRTDTNVAGNINITAIFNQTSADNFLLQWGSQGSGVGQFNSPQGVAGGWQRQRLYS